jgi:rhamnosyltransferase
MATFNGASYIEDQMQSLIAQSFSGWNLIIHDDGSTDGTLDVLRNYVEKDKRIKIIEDGIQLKSASANFLYLLKHSTAQYIIFCDQDDIWMPAKLEQLLIEIEKESGPAAVYCNSYLFTGKKISRKMATLYERSDLKNTLFLNSGVQGSCLMFNRQLLEIILPFPAYVQMHDHLVTLAAATFGKLKYIDKSLMYYRQHDRNVTGNMEVNLIKRAFSFFTKSESVIDYKHYKGVRSFYDQYEKAINAEQKAIFLNYFTYAVADSIISRIRIVLSNNFKIGNSCLSLLFKTVLKKPINQCQE